MEPTDITIEILKGIREDIQGVREESHRTRSSPRGSRSAGPRRRPRASHRGVEERTE
jgi:hypothetical protein